MGNEYGRPAPARGRTLTEGDDFFVCRKHRAEERVPLGEEELMEGVA